MPAKGKPKLTTAKKAKIIAEKELGISTVKNIAQQNGVVENTVYKTVREITPEVRNLADTYKAQIIDQSRLNVADGLKIMRERMDDADSKLSEITGAVKISHDIMQVQTGGPTDIHAIKPIDLVMDWIAKCRTLGMTNEEIINDAYQIPDFDDEIRGKIERVLGEPKRIN